MKIKDSFILSEIGDSYIVVPTGADTVDLNGMITLNDTGAYLWKKLQEDISVDELADQMAKEYDIDKNTVLNDISNFIERLKAIGAICE